MHPEFWVVWQEPVRALLAEEGGPDELRTVLGYLLQVNTELDQEKLGDVMQKHFGPEAEEVAKTAGQRLIQQGLLQGRQAAQQQGQARLLRQLQLRFGSVSAEVVARVQGADDVALDRLSERIITAQTLGDVFDDS